MTERRIMREPHKSELIPVKRKQMTVDQLCYDQLMELKRDWMREFGDVTPTQEMIENPDAYVSDEDIEKAYGDRTFTDDDFYCTSTPVTYKQSDLQAAVNAILTAVEDSFERNRFDSGYVAYLSQVCHLSAAEFESLVACRWQVEVKPKWP